MIEILEQIQKVLNTTTQNLVTTDALNHHWETLAQRTGFGNTYFSEFMKPIVSLHVHGQLDTSTNLEEMLKAEWKGTSQITAMNSLIHEARKLEGSDEHILQNLVTDLVSDPCSLNQLYQWHVQYLTEISKTFLPRLGVNALTLDRFYLANLNRPSIANNIVVPVASPYDTNRLRHTILPTEKELACMYALGLQIISITDPNHAGRIDSVLYFVDRDSREIRHLPGFFAWDLARHDFGHIDRDSGVPEEYLEKTRHSQKKFLDMAFRLALLEVALEKHRSPLDFYQSSRNRTFFSQVGSGEYLTTYPDVVDVLRSKYGIEPTSL